jgi:acyl-CoA thioester hydrolase
MLTKEFFKTKDGDPKPLTCEVKRKVRFDELDPLNVMWHGNYASFFEDVRVAMGEKYNIGYLTFANSGVIIPIKRFFVDYISPLEFNKEYTIKAILHWNEAPRLDFEYEIYSSTNMLVTRAYTIQLMTDKERNLVLKKPKFYEEFCNKWKQGLIK